MEQKARPRISLSRGRNDGAAEEMERAARREQLARTLNTHAQSIHATFQVFDEPAASSLEKVDWSEVIRLGEEVSKQATITGMLCTGEMPDARELEENIGTYCNVLQGFLLVCHGSTVCAGPTLLAYTRASAEQVIGCSLSLLREAVSSYGSLCSDKKTTIPRLSGAVWEACTALKKTPVSNCMAIGRAITQTAVSMKDVLREIRELKPAAINFCDETPETSDITCDSREDDSGSEAAFGSDLSPEEMDIANLAIEVVSDTLTVVKESIRFLTDLIKKHVHGASPDDNIQSLEQILKCFQETGVQVDELGACLYPPQELSQLRAATVKMLQLTSGIRIEVQNIGISSEALIRSLEVLETSLRKLKSAAAHPDTDLVQEIGRLVV